MDEIFKNAGLPQEYKNECENFYRPYFKSDEELKIFFEKIFEKDIEDKNPRRIMNQICRFVSLAEDIEKIRPGRDPLRVLFLRMGLESIYKIIGIKKRKKVGDFFEKFVSEEGKQYILSNFKFSFLEPEFLMSEQERSDFDDCSNYDLIISDFSKIFFEIRGMVAHEGDWWSMQLFSRDEKYTWLVDMTTDETLIGGYTGKEGYPINYHFETTMNYEKFIYYFTEGCITFLQRYLMEGKENFKKNILK